jgi:hypothetical protein
MSDAQLRSLQEDQTSHSVAPRKSRTRRERLRVLENNRDAPTMTIARTSPRINNDGTCAIFESSKVSNNRGYGDYIEEKKEELPIFGSSCQGVSENAKSSSFTLHKPSPERPGPSKRNSSSKGSMSSDASSGKESKLSSPMARMRDPSTQEASRLKGNKRSSKSRTPKSHEEVKKEKQQKWKRQMKRAQKHKMREKKALEAGLAPTGGQNFMECVLNDLEPNRFFELFRTQCGTLADAASESSSDSGSGDSSDTGEESDSSQSAEAKDSPPRQRQRQRQRRKSKTPKRKERTRRDPEQSDPEASPPSESRLPPEQTAVLSPGAPSPRTADGYLSPGLTAQMENLAPPPQISRQTMPPQGEPLQNLATPTTWINPMRTSTPVSTIASSAVKPKDRFFVKAFITEAVEIGFSMLWHKEQASMKPAPVTLRLKGGHQTPNSTQCCPRLVWSDQKNDRYGFSLFQIRSLERAKPSHLKDVPFAIPGRSICLKLHGDKYFVFEASSEDDAWRFVHGLRWVIARLSFNLVIGNVEVSCELLDVRIKTNEAKSPSLFEEFERAKAMDDVTEQLVDSLVVTEDTSANMMETPLFPPELSSFF